MKDMGKSEFSVKIRTSSSSDLAVKCLKIFEIKLIDSCKM